MSVRVHMCVWLCVWACVGAAGRDKSFGPRWFCAGGGSGEDDSITASESGEGREGAPCTCSPLPDAIPDAKRMDCAGRGFTNLTHAIKLPAYVAALDLSDNPVRFFDSPRFGDNQQLRTLTLRNTLLIKVSGDTLAGLPNLRTLDISQNRLETLPDNFLQNQTQLRVLDLSSNFIEGLPIDFFQNVTNLDTLSLSDNSEIGRYIHGSAEALRDVLKRGLRCLKIEHVGLSSIPENFFHDDFHLKELHISNNPFTTLPQLNLGTLQVLNVSGTNISTIPDSNFLTLPNLRRLYMERMLQLHTVEQGAFVGMKFLEVLSLEKCHNLSLFNAMAFGLPVASMPPLKRLSLAHDGLQTLSPKLFAIFRNVTDLRLHGNPWICDCKLSWFKNLNLSKENEKHLRCFLPRSLHHRPWSSLERSNFVCVDKRARLLYGFMVTLVVIFSLVILATLIAIGSTIRRKWFSQRSITRKERMTYERMNVQLHSNTMDAYWEDTDSIDSHRPVSFIRDGHRL